MTAFDHLLPSTNDDLDRRFAIALADVPEAERAIKSAIWTAVRGIERQLNQIQTGLRDCNVVLARTVDHAERFLAMDGVSHDG